MNKKKFLKLLEIKLKVLEEKEIKDILDEYSNMIDEKIKKGKTEEEAIADFENIDELAKEILKAYKINPNYIKESATKTEEVVKSIENTISDVAKKASKGFKKLYKGFEEKNGEFNFELLFEIIFKVIIIFLGLVILKLPFDFIKSVGKELIYTLLFSPLDKFVYWIWALLIAISYLGCSVFIIMQVFKKYFLKEEITKKEKKSIKAEKVEDKIEEKIEEKKITKGSNVVTKIIQLFMSFIFLLPIWFINFSIAIALTIVIYLLIKGVALLGILVLLIGLNFMFGFLASLIKNLIYKFKVNSIVPFIISIILITFGCILTVEESLSYSYSNQLDESSFKKELIYQENISNETTINANGYETNIEVDDTLLDNQIVIKIDYYVLRTIEVEKNNDTIKISSTILERNKELYETFIEELKNKKVYDYHLLDDVKITIYVNETTKSLIN